MKKIILLAVLLVLAFACEMPNPTIKPDNKENVKPNPDKKDNPNQGDSKPNDNPDKKDNPNQGDSKPKPNPDKKDNPNQGNSNKNEDKNKDPKINWDNISSADYELSADGLILVKWKNSNTKNLDMSKDPKLQKVTTIGEKAFSESKSLVHVYISNSVKKIENVAFSSLSNLKTVIMSNSITSTGVSLFDECENLEKVVLSSSLKKIEETMFYNCVKLKNIIIPNSVTSIGFGVFQYSGITDIDIPNSVSTIEKNAFENCNKLESITIRKTSLMVYTEYLLNITPSLKHIYVPSNLLASYKKADGWSDFSDKIKAI